MPVGATRATVIASCPAPLSMSLSAVIISAAPSNASRRLFIGVVPACESWPSTVTIDPQDDRSRDAADADDGEKRTPSSLVQQMTSIGAPGLVMKYVIGK